MKYEQFINNRLQLQENVPAHENAAKSNFATLFTGIMNKLLIVNKISHFLDKQDLVILTKAPLLAHF